jgi:hypothetical protein
MPFAETLAHLRALLSQEPRHTWPDAVVHHAARVLLLLGLALLVQFLFPILPAPDLPSAERGEVLENDIVARMTFDIPKSPEELTREREEAAASVPLVFHYEPEAVDSMLPAVRQFVALLDSAAAVGGGENARREAIRDVLLSYGFEEKPEEVTVLMDAGNRRLLDSALEAAVRASLPAGVAQSAELETRSQQATIIRPDGSRQLVARDSIPTGQSFFSSAGDFLDGAPPALKGIQRLVLIRLFRPSLLLDTAATEADRARARAAVGLTKGRVMENERVVPARQQVTEEDLQRLAAYQEQLRAEGVLQPGADRWRRATGAFILNVTLLAIFGLVIFFYRGEVYRDFRHVLLLAGLIAVTTGAAAAIARGGAPAELVPLAFPVLVIAMLWDGRMALNMALVLAILLSAQTPFVGMAPRLTMVVGGAAAALSVRVVRRRAQGLVLGGVVAGAYAATCLALALLRSDPLTEVLTCAMWGAVNGVGAALLAMGFLPLFEAITRITTDQTLLELADLNRPLLKRLSLEASGTYAHSINVANLAEAAARSIDANALLVRVGAYYHDVGKMKSPHYFIENQARGRNPHDRLDPDVSATIVRNHVTEGIKLAEQHKLPESVRAFIPEHHGTQAIGFFMDKARQEDPDRPLNIADFSYSGPRPRSRETAILMLADSIESAAKVLTEPTPERIRALVDRIVEGKIAQQQLVDAPLTMRELEQIKRQFAAVLTGMYHHRIDYPTAPGSPPAGGADAADAAAPADEPAPQGASHAPR